MIDGQVKLLYLKGLALGHADRDIRKCRELAAAIPGAQLKMYPQWGHGLYEEAKDFLPRIREFLGK